MMKVNDGESASSNQESRPTSNFCDAYLSYLSRASTRSPSSNECFIASESSEELGVLQMGTGKNHSSKWAFYHKSSSQSPDQLGGRVLLARSPDKGISEKLTIGKETLNVGVEGQHTSKDLGIGSNFVDKNKKEVFVSVSSAREQLNSNKACLKPSCEQFGEKCLRVTIEQIDVNDECLKLGREILEVYGDQGRTGENLNSLPTAPEINVSLGDGKQAEGSYAKPETSASADISDENNTIRPSLSRLRHCRSDNRNLKLGHTFKESGDTSNFPKGDERSGSNDWENGGGCNKSHTDRLEAMQSSDISESSRVEVNDSCIELSDEDDANLANHEQKNQKEHIAEELLSEDRTLTHSNTIIKPSSKDLPDGNERSRFSCSTLRSSLRRQFGVKTSDGSYKNSWRKKIVKKHLVSEKLKTQATRLLNADRPKRNIGQKKTDEASIGLSRQEELDLNRALYASLHTQKPKHKLSATTASNAVDDDTTETSHDGTSQSSFLFGRTSVYPNQNGFFGYGTSGMQAQRKFASGSNTVASVGTKRKGKRPGANSKILVSKKAKTEDFLTFLCLRERTTVFPSLLDFIHGLQNSGFQQRRESSSSSAKKVTGVSEAEDCCLPNVQLLPPLSPVKFSPNEVTQETAKIGENTLSSLVDDNMSKSEDIFSDAYVSAGQEAEDLNTDAESQINGLHCEQQTTSLSPSNLGRLLNHAAPDLHKDICTTSSEGHGSSAVSGSVRISSASHENRQKTKSQELSKGRLRPSTRAMTAARADEQLMLAKQQHSPPSLRDLEEGSTEAKVVDNCNPSQAISEKELSASSDEQEEEEEEEEEEEDNLIENAQDKLLHLKGKKHFKSSASEVVFQADDESGTGASRCDELGESDERLEMRSEALPAVVAPGKRAGRGWTEAEDPGSSSSPAKHGLSSLFQSGVANFGGALTQEVESINGTDVLRDAKAGNQVAEVSSACHIPRIPSSFSLFPSSEDPACVVNGPSYHPSEEQFEDPIQYIELIQPNADPFGMCRVIPPDGWKVDCCISQELRFTTRIQFVSRLRHRCGPNSFQLDCIRKHLESQKIQMEQIPLLNGIQVDLVALSKAVKQCGGLQSVIDRNSWAKVAKMMHLPKYDKDKAQRLCQIYCRYLLSYDMLTEDERQKLEKLVIGRCQPTNYDLRAKCFAKGKSRTLGEFFNVARNATSLYFDHEPSSFEVEAEYWRLVGEGERHVAVHVVHINTDQSGSAFPEKKDSPYSRHGWNFNVLKKNEGSLLQNLGHVEDVTSSMLHVGMLFSTRCWFRHRHYLPFIHYLHAGADIIWYCIPANEANKFQKFLQDVIPNAKDVELESEQSFVMVSPEELISHGISVSRVVQKHGEYVIVFPEAFTSYICSGYSLSESMYFATPGWIPHGCKSVKVLKEKSLPAVFSLTKLLFSAAFGSQPHPDVFELAFPYLQETISAELHLRKKVKQLGLKRSTSSHDEHVLCEVCKTICFLSAIVSEQEDVVYCLEHGCNRLQKKKKFSSFKMLYQFEELDLVHMLERKASEVSRRTLEMD